MTTATEVRHTSSSVSDVEQPTVLIADHLQWTRDGRITATFLVTPKDYGMRGASDKADVKDQHGFLIQELPDGTQLWSCQTDMDMRKVLARQVRDIDLDTHEQYAQEALATWERVCAIGPTEALMGITIPIGKYDTGAALTPTDNDIQDYKAKANKIIVAMGDAFRPTPMPAPLFEFLWDHALCRGVDRRPAPRDASTTPAAARFQPAAMDEGARTDPRRKHRRFLSDRNAVLKVIPTVTDVPASYQAMLVIESFPYPGSQFPGATEFLSALVGATRETVDWSMRVTRLNADRVLRKNTRALRGVGEQMEQRDSEVSFAQSTLQKKVMLLHEYTNLFEEDSGRSEVSFTTVIAVGAPTADRLDIAVESIKRTLKRFSIRLDRPVSVQTELWELLNLGATHRPVWDRFAHVTPDDMWAGFVPFIRADLGDSQGPIIAINLGSGHFEPVHSDMFGVTERDMSGCFAAVGELGSGKSYFLKSCLDLVYSLGGQWIAVDRTDMGEYQKFAEGLPEDTRTIVDASRPQWSLDPLRLFANSTNDDDGQLAADFTIDTLLPLMDISPTDAIGVLFSNLLAPKARHEWGITDSHRLMNAVAQLAAQRGPDAHQWAELSSRLTAWAARAPVLFDPTLPTLDLNSRATVIRTHRLALADRDELTVPHLYRQLSAKAKLGTCIYSLIGVMARAALFNSDDLGLFNGDEAYHFTVSNVGRRIVDEFARDGRKHKAILALSSHAPGADYDSIASKLIPTRYVFRQRDRDLAEDSLRWIDIDPDTDPFALNQLRTNTSPMRGEDFDSVPAHRRGECFVRDSLGRLSHAKILGPSLSHRRQAVGTTPGRQAS